jgi:hypothetical protein
MTEPLSKVDSAVEGVDAGKDAKDTKKPRMSSIAAPGVWNIKDIGTFSPIARGFTARTSADTRGTEEQKIELQIAPETQKTGW